MSDHTTAPPHYLVGVDLAQASDYTAISVLTSSLAEGGDRRYDLGYLERLQHVSYMDVGAHLRALVADLRMPVGADRIPIYDTTPGGLAWLHHEERPIIPKVTLAYDRTGVGAACADILQAAKIDASLKGVLIHGGDKVIHDRRVYRVPKRDLVGALIVAFQNGTLKIAPSLPLGRTLSAELVNFKLKLNPDTMHDSYAAWRAGAHDDLVLATALAIWYGERSQPAVSVPSVGMWQPSRWS
jgi:hypothetical protein